MRIGIMQGRLVPPEGDTIQAFPRAAWAEELPRAAAAGLDGIEWIYDRHGEGHNPIETDAGIAELRAIADAHAVHVRSICADWFMEHSLVRADAAGRAAWHARLAWLLGRAARLEATHVVLPFVDAASIRNAADEALVIDAVERALPAAERAGIELHLETALGPAAFRALLERLPHPLVRANYDTGNSAALGHDPREELAAYGARIGSVHVKDRVRGGGTVPLGRGAADLVGTFEALRALDYARPLVLQVARGTPGDEVAWATHNRQLVTSIWRAAAPTLAPVALAPAALAPAALAPAVGR